MQDMDAVYRQNAALVHKYLLRLTGGQAHLAEELTQETFCKVVSTIIKPHCRISYPRTRVRIRFSLTLSILGRIRGHLSAK